MRTFALLTAVVSLLAAGCTPTSEQRDQDFQLQKLERENNRLSRELSTERARALVLEKRIAAEETQWAANRAEMATYREEIDSLRRENQQLHAKIRESLFRPVERPDVSISPLPDEVDRDLMSWSQRFANRVSYDRGRGAVSFANDELFETGSDTVREDARMALNDLAGILATLPDDYEVVVVGHTDNVPISKPETLAVHPSNWHLSVHRAVAVKDVLVHSGFSADRLGVMGYGPHRPVSDDRAQNRRVEIFIVREGAVQTFAPVQP